MENKKTMEYCAPVVKEIELNFEQAILSGSDPTSFNSENGTESMGTNNGVVL